MTTADQQASLRQAGFDDSEMQALDHAWRNDSISRVLDPVAAEVRAWGGSAAQAFDAVQHGLTFEHVITYLVHGFTAHQVHVLLRDPNCRAVLEPLSLDEREAHFLNRPSIPRQVIVHVLRIAHSSSEAKMFLAQYERALDRPVKTDHGYQTADELAAAYENQVALGAAEPYCGCG